MNTTDHLSPEKQIDNFILHFHSWLSQNYIKTGDDEYRDKLDKVTPEKDITFLTTAECLDLYRKEQIPPLPAIPDTSVSHLLSVAEVAIKRNRILFSGLQKIQYYLASAAVFHKDDINNIISETMDQIA